MRAATGHPANLSIQVDNIEASKEQGLAQGGLLADRPPEASVHHQAGLSVRLLGEGEVLSAAFVVVAALEAMEEVMEEAAMAVAAEDTGKLKEKVSEERAKIHLSFKTDFFMAVCSSRERDQKCSSFHRVLPSMEKGLFLHVENLKYPPPGESAMDSKF